MRIPVLVDLETCHAIFINKLVYRIGSNQSYVDFYIPEPSVSRLHCNIIQKNEDVFIIDMNSLNHTYVDGHAIDSNTEYPLKHKTIIRIANKSYLFLETEQAVL